MALNTISPPRGVNFRNAAHPYNGHYTKYVFRISSQRLNVHVHSRTYDDTARIYKLEEAVRGRRMKENANSPIEIINTVMLAVSSYRNE